VHSYDAVVVGAGPNGLAAAVTVAQTGKSVLVVEAGATIGGGTRSGELTLPGFTHDVCSAIHPLAVASPFFRSLPLSRYGLSFVHPDAPLAHPLDDGTAVVLERSVEDTGKWLERDALAYRKLMAPLVEDAEAIIDGMLGPIRIPRHPFALARFGLSAIRSTTGLAGSRFDGERAPALIGGIAAHSMLSLRRPPTAGDAIMLALIAHAVGWPIPRGGSQKIADALGSLLGSLGGEIVTDWKVTGIDELPPARAYLFDVTPRQLVALAGGRLPPRYRRELERFRYGPGVFKVDWALDGPVPWKASECGRAGTVHVGGSLAELVASEDEVTSGRIPERPYVLAAQQSLFDRSRAPEGRQTLWAYCHVPPGSDFDMTERIEAQIERFAPGFRDRILARSILPPSELERYNANYVGGDINGGVADLRQLFTRPAARLNPYTTPARDIYICSSSTPPTGGVHGMCGYWAARAALRRALRRS
jgi:phytoene dehydrogenase-like protein